MEQLYLSFIHFYYKEDGGQAQTHCLKKILLILWIVSIAYLVFQLCLLFPYSESLIIPHSTWWFWWLLQILFCFKLFHLTLSTQPHSHFSSGSWLILPCWLPLFISLWYFSLCDKPVIRSIIFNFWFVLVKHSRS